MKIIHSVSNQNRRRFISFILPACTLPCFAFSGVFADEIEKGPIQEAKETHKFQKPWGHSYEEAFEWRFGYYIDIMERFSEYLGRDRLIKMIMQAVDESSLQNSANDLDFSFAEWIQGGSVYQNMMTREIIEQTENTYEIKVTECLWAKTFQARNAADLGYATICYSDFSSAKAAHPLIKLERSKTIMQGHGYCNHRWIWQGKAN
jgi:hypothetical protein